MASKGSITPCLRGILRLNQCLYPLTGRISTRKYSAVLPSKEHEAKYGELRNRFAEVPYLKLVEREADSVHHDLCYEEDEVLEDVLKWNSKVFNYNVRNNETLHANMLLKTFCTYGFSLDNPNWNHWDSDAWRSAALLAWCVKLIFAYANIIDDILDNSRLKNGITCWHQKAEVGLYALNDSQLLLAGIYKLLEKHFGTSKCYFNLVHEILKGVRDTAYSQTLVDGFKYRNQKQGFQKLSFECYEAVSKYKSSPLSYDLPVRLAMHFAGGCTKKDFEVANKLCLKLGVYLVIQDDYADCFGKNEVELSGRMGTDIREGFFTWFSMKFLEGASEPMKKQFLENYGVDDENAIANVLELYRKANLSEKFEEYEKKLYNDISNIIESMNDVKGYLFYDIFADTGKRER